MIDDSENRPVYNQDQAQASTLGSSLSQKIGDNNIIKGYGNIVDPSSKMVWVTGNNNTVGGNCYGVALMNSSGCVVPGNMSMVTIFNSSGVTAWESNLVIVNNQNIGDKPIRIIYSNLTLTAKDSGTLFLVDTSSGTVTLTFDSAVNLGKSFKVQAKKISVANTMTIATKSPETIDGNSTYSTSIQWNSYVFYCDGVNQFFIL